MSTKRRAGRAASPELSTPDTAKRIRKPNTTTYFPDHESVKTTQELGGKAIGLLRKSTDKTNRLIITHFVDLPDRDDYPDYYEQIAMPLSLNMIEDKLNDGQYATMEKLESDLKRMVQNAKDYNSSKSEIFEDAERIRKNLSNFMPRHNPAYLNPEYRAYPTPIPQTLIDRMNQQSSASGSQRTSAEPAKVKLVFNKGGKRRQSQAASGEEEDTSAELEARQVELLNELSEQGDAINFEDRVSKRQAPDYYRVIQRPTSINDVRKAVQKGEITDWSTFAKEVRLIWSNAKEYNEPGSDIYVMAQKLETWFDEKLQEHGVAPRMPTKITLSQPKPKQIKLKLSSTTPTPSTPNATIDPDALRRQKEDTDQALVRSTRAASRNYTNGSTPVPSIPSGLRRSVSISAPTDTRPALVNGNVAAPPPPSETVKMAAPPGPNNIPTPTMAGEPPHMQAALLPNGASANLAYARKSFESDNPIERKFRDAGKGIEDALLASVTYMTHPSLPNDPRWKLSRSASATKTQTSYYTYLPHDHSYLRVMPALTKEVHTRRSHKLVVSHNWQPIQPVPSMQPGVPGYYEFGLRPGENTIAVDVIADLRDGQRKDYAPPQLQVDFERITFYIFLRNRDE